MPIRPNPPSSHKIGFLEIEPGSRIFRSSLQNGRFTESRDVTLPGFWTSYGGESVWLTEETMSDLDGGRVYIIHRPNGQKLQVTAIPALYGDYDTNRPLIVGVDVVYEINRQSAAYSPPSTRYFGQYK